jgi:hypothetical protein
MSISNTPFIPSPKSQSGIIAFHTQTMGMINQQWNIREQMRKIDLRYSRELDYTKDNQQSKLANSYGDADKVQNLQIPVVLPAVESAVVYQTSVFLTGTPIFDVVSGSTTEDAAMGMAAVIDENSIRGGWVRHLQMFFRDGFKYNLSAVEIDWERKVTFAIPTDYGTTNKKELDQIIWEGNVIRRWDPYNTFWDTRLPLTEVSENGEFAGNVQLMSRIALKKFIAALPTKIIPNIKPAFESGFTGGAVTSSSNGRYYIPPINSRINYISTLAGTDWMAWASASEATKGGRIDIDYKNIYEVTTLYARILPMDFGMIVPAAATPQIWKFIIVNSQVVIFAERQTNAHERIPVLFAQPNEDGLSYQTKSLAENVAPIQDITTALANSVLAARRRAISDRGIYDPSRIAEKNINSTNPSAKIPVKPAAYGKPLGEAYYPIPFEDRNSVEVMGLLGPLTNYANIITGQNPARQGQFVKGNKTENEFNTVMQNANGRDQSTSLLYEAQVFTPLKEMLKLNILQYQPKTSFYYRGTQEVINIDPVKLRQASLTFKMSDGLTPTSKLISADTFQTAMQVIGSTPQLAGAYNIGPMFSYLMKTQQAHIEDFEKSKEQVAYEQAVGQWQQMAQLAIQNKQPFGTPQPKPADYGYMVNGKLKQDDEEGETTDDGTQAMNDFISTLNATVANSAAQNG